ncbi:hypothetical protein PCANC_12046 [Puccinia coronata f. sp. avenae]|uniref:Uncharacterized protein n=1 Tax=Puccinia coronata f. sp. avenae TaxID=200324 RepID=A0A2N5T0H5_9BASI|nr:hypothetical protein PCASD_20124 [Puccinia coronata f. sp. avenae]PLW20063.1 hypothetical protein PCANC_12046 [Puccinia coronata f. sp. avenae]
MVHSSLLTRSCDSSRRSTAIFSVPLHSHLSSVVLKPPSSKPELLNCRLLVSCVHRQVPGTVAQSYRTELQHPLQGRKTQPHGHLFDSPSRRHRPARIMRTRSFSPWTFAALVSSIAFFGHTLAGVIHSPTDSCNGRQYIRPNTCVERYTCTKDTHCGGIIEFENTQHFCANCNQLCQHLRTQVRGCPVHDPPVPLPYRSSRM